MQVVGGKARRKETTRKTKMYVDGYAMMNLRELVWGGIKWTDLAQDRNRWRAIENTTLNL
jgi:hypothetical protein